MNQADHGLDSSLNALSTFLGYQENVADGARSHLAIISTDLGYMEDLYNLLAEKNLGEKIKDMLLKAKSATLFLLGSSNDSNPQTRLNQLQAFQEAYEYLFCENFFTDKDLLTLQKIFTSPYMDRATEVIPLVTQALTQIGIVHRDQTDNIIQFFATTLSQEPNLLEKLTLADEAIDTILKLSHYSRNAARTALVEVYTAIQQQLTISHEPKEVIFSRSYPRFMLKRKLEQGLKLLSADETDRLAAIGLLGVAATSNATTPGVDKRIFRVLANAD